ncbi:MAG TPA: hypothetical protein VGE74_04615 [Gemmata sp.]
MKAAGVKTGSPIWDAKRMRPEGASVKRDFYWHEVLSRTVLGIAGSFAPKVGCHSVDEFVFECPPLSHRMGFAETARPATTSWGQPGCRSRSGRSHANAGEVVQ